MALQPADARLSVRWHPAADVGSVVAGWIPAARASRVSEKPYGMNRDFRKPNAISMMKMISENKNLLKITPNQ